MAGIGLQFYLNDGSDTFRDYSSGNASFPTIDYFRWSREGYNFLYWNTASDGSGTTYYADAPIPESLRGGGGPFYAIWEAVNPTVTYYITNSTELTSVADAIRAKGGTSASLVYPTGFVSAIENLNIDESVITITLHGEKIADGYRLYFTASDVAKIINAWIVKVEIVEPATHVIFDSLYTFYVSSKNDSSNSLCYFYMAGTNNIYFTFNPNTGAMVRFYGNDLIYDSENNYYYWEKINSGSN